jgi:1-hydroxycarotenoid 3,4-desaturase
LVHTFAAVPAGVDLKQHNVFFADDPKAEFDPLAKGENPTDATLYIHAQDRDRSQPLGVLERFEIILNAPSATSEDPAPSEEIEKCQTQVFDRLGAFGLTFSPTPKPSSLTTPQMFDQMFPASNGSLYGRSPHGLMAAFNRPTARTKVKGLYLVGGGAHPGAGVPMATLSAQHAAAAILNDQTLTSTSQLADTRGGTSMGSAMTG